MSRKWWMVVAVALFGIGIALGVVTPTNMPLANELSFSLKELSRILVPFSFLTTITIIAKNVLAMLLSFLLSPILCLMPFLSLMVNGWLMGFVSAAVVHQESIWYLLAGVLPHGIFELPAMIMAQAAALSFGVAIMLSVFQKKRRAMLVPHLWRDLKLLLLACALLLPAAFIETYVTPLLLGR